MSSFPPPPPQAGYAPPPPPAIYPPQKQSRNWIPWAIAGGCGCLLLIGALIIAIPIFLGVKAATAGPEAVAKEFLAAGARGDATAAYEYFSEPLKQAQSYEEFANGVNNNPEFFQVVDTTYTTRSIDMQGAKLEGTAKLANGNEVPIAFTFVKDGEVWKLLGYTIGNP